MSLVSDWLQTSGGLLVDRDKVLLGLRASWKSSWPEHWDSIGGRLEVGETPADALVREIEEEIGIIATRFALLASVEGALPDIHGQMTCNIFAVTQWTGQPFIACDEHTELRWFTPEQLDQLPNLAGAGYPTLAREAIACAAAELHRTANFNG